MKGNDGVADMKDSSEVIQETTGKGEWMTPELLRMSVDQTLSGHRNARAETMSGHPNVPGFNGS
ncbi:hypothetical protein QLQ86_13585 [Halomonas sp. LR5S13]|uniref:hypothetical protein n=1 Tax=Halomonas rhizosphaerae TaxID=3043296 RepID=UPI0024A7ADEF|nr:hypothetical protein [Halomonas rhizosphaerae]MDI5921825.1 hypothetical protein [Halomonas rhizosphaerae]